MTLTLRALAFALLACLAGLVASELIFRSSVCRDLIGRTFGRGHLVALVDGNGVYEIDLRREMMADCYASGLSQDQPLAREEIRNASDRLAVNAAIRASSRNESVAASSVSKECDLLRSQFENERAFTERMRTCGFSRESLSTTVADNLKARQWIEKQIASQIAASEEECREFYHTHRDAFASPQRFRASHLFLAAPPETPEEVVESKRVLIESLAQRIEQGEDFSALVAEASEDEATKGRGGDLGFFASSRMFPEFFAAAATLRLGELSKPVRSHLGFHIIQLTAIEPARLIPFEEARAEITGILRNDQRRLLAGELGARPTRDAKYFGGAR